MDDVTPITPDPPWEDPVLWANLIAHASRFIRPRSEMERLSKPQAFSMMGLIAAGELARDAYRWQKIAEMPGYDRCHAFGRLAFGEIPA